MKLNLTFHSVYASESESECECESSQMPSACARSKYSTSTSDAKAQKGIKYYQGKNELVIHKEIDNSKGGEKYTKRGDETRRKRR